MSMIKGGLGKMWAFSRRKRGNLVTQDMEEAVVFNDFLASVFTNECCSHTAQVTEAKTGDGKMNCPL